MANPVSRRGRLRSRGCARPLRVSGAHSRVTGNSTLVEGRVGQRLRAITGRLTSPAGPVELRDPSGALAATATPAASGEWRLTRVKLARPGAWTLMVNRQRVGRITVVLAPTIAWRRSLRGRVLRIDGSLLPAMSGKQVVLEWRSPSDGHWRPVAFARTSTAGRFGLIYRFQNPAIAKAVRMRVAVPAERGVPLTATTGKAFTPAAR